jgi:4-hydroxybutyrate dehydrogenase
MKTQIHKFESVSQFFEQFNITENDLIVTHEFLYKPFFQYLNHNAKVIFQEKYGAGEPSYEMMKEILSDLDGVNYKRVIAVGGGTVLDIAKLLILKKPKSLMDLYQKKEQPVKEKELIIIPTTCGTGSEVTNISVLKFKDKQSKIGLVSDEILPDHSIIIPDIVKNLPYKFFVYSSIDALIHAIESYVSPKSNCYTELFSVKAIEMILSGYLKILHEGTEYRKEIIEDFLIASNYAGIAFFNTGVGAVHALSFPLGGQYDVPHGEANYQCFTEVFKTYNRLNPDGKIKKLNSILVEALGIENKDRINVYDALEIVLNEMITKKKLSEYGMKEEEIYSFTDTVIESQQRLLVNTYVPLSKQDIIDIYKKLY